MSTEWWVEPYLGQPLDDLWGEYMLAQMKWFESHPADKKTMEVKEGMAYFYRDGSLFMVMPEKYFNTEGAIMKPIRFHSLGPYIFPEHIVMVEPADDLSCFVITVSGDSVKVARPAEDVIKEIVKGLEGNILLAQSLPRRMAEEHYASR